MERKIPMSAAERKRLSRQRLKKKMAEKMSESEVATAKQNERERVVKAVKKTRENKKATMSSDDLKAYKLSESARVNKIQKEKREAIKMDREKAAEALVSIANRKVVQPYKTRQSFSKALKSAREALPSSPRKRAAVISGLASEVGMRMESNFIKSLTSSAREEVRNYVREFYYRADISYTAPGMKEEMTVWDENGKRQLRKYYLTMFLCEAYRVFIDTADKEFHCSRSVFCALRPQNVLLLNDSPKDQCKCQTHENFFMKLEAMGHSYSGLFWGTILCDLTPNSDCWTNKCEECKDGKRFVPLKELTAMTNYKQWNFVEVESRKPKKPKVAENDEKKETYTKIVQSVQEVQVQVVLNEFQEQFESITAHVNVKRIQEKEFQADLNNADVRVLQIDYAMAYQCENQNEVYGALWTRGSVNLFTSALYHKGTTNTLIYCTNYKGKDKWCNGVAIEDIYDTYKTTDDIREEIIWSDGPTSEYKNRFMCYLISYLSAKYGKPFTWKFSATAHGKCVVDGVGGRVKSLVRLKTMSKGKNRDIVQNSEDFVALATKLCKNIAVKHIKVDEIEGYQLQDRFKFAKAIPGISVMHVVRSEGLGVNCWRNSCYQSEQIAPHATCKFSDTSDPVSFPIQGNSEERETIAYMDVVTIRNDPFKGYYAVIIQSVNDDEDEDAEVKINYLKKSGNKLVIAPNDLDMRPISDFKKVSAKIDGNSRYFVAFLDE